MNNTSQQGGAVGAAVRTYGVHFDYVDALYQDQRLAHLSYTTSHGDTGAFHAVACMHRLRPTSCVLKLKSIYGELIGLAPAGMAVN